MIGSSRGWAVGPDTAQIYTRTSPPQWRSKGSTAPFLSFVKVGGTWRVDLDNLEFSNIAKKVKPIPSKVTGWNVKAIKVKKGKIPAARKIVVAASTGKVVLERKSGKKWVRVSTATVNATTGRATVRFAKLRTKGTYTFRLRLTGTDYYKLDGVKNLKVKVKQPHAKHQLVGPRASSG
ncbi:hypothetical protein GCM10010401_15600 [Rarobacter faecitabidus]|uniref:Uncharacterized protein n=1 Tax=Rarobacter faecitabidus TaxID=13243 RepID=A0A542ZXK7_RARFA|nr:hypothetical protein [Rarobacter faecitabidus]TQL65039.1 hypothetical protein FB461_1572 [Rarobacter faecitabidus]